MSKFHFTWFLVPLLILMLIGCSGDGGGPVSPDLHNQAQQRSEASVPVLLGLYDIVLDSSTMTAEITPLRVADFQVNIVKFLQPPDGNPANLGLKMNPDGTIISEGLFDVDISITHPMVSSNYRGFDVRGILLSKATQLSQFNYDVQFPAPDQTRLLNADGYTRWWNAVEFLTPGLFGYTQPVLGHGNPKGNVNAFKYFCDDLAAEDPFDPNVDIRGTFSTQTMDGDPNKLTRNYVIKFPVVGGTPKAEFRYAICASFFPPSSGYTPPAPLEAYPPKANCPEPYKIGISVDPSSTAFYTSVQSGGDLIVKVEIFDWQAQENPEGVPGELGFVRMESPTLWPGLIDPVNEGISIPTDNPTSSAWQVEILDVTPDEAQQDIFITAQSKEPNTYTPPVPGSIYPGSAVLSAYHLYTYELPDNTAPIIGVISGPQMYSPGVTLKYKLSKMNDLQDGPNLTVTWDFNGDGVFEDDEDGSDTNKQGTYTFEGPGAYSVQCRVTDTQGAYTDSNIIDVEEISLPYEDPMDDSTRNLWNIENGVFGLHDTDLQWNVQSNSHWSSSSPTSGTYENDMNTLLISPGIPTGVKDKIFVQLTHKFETETYFDSCQVYYRLNSGSWMTLSPLYDGSNTGWPDYTLDEYTVTGFSSGDILELGFLFESDGYAYYYDGWDLDHLMVLDNTPPIIEDIYGPQICDSLGPHTYSTVAMDIDGISSYMWSVEVSGEPPVYDDPGDGMGSIEVSFPADGAFDIHVQATDAGEPPLTTEFGPYTVSIFSINPDAFFSDDFTSDTGQWTFTGGIDDGSYQDFWHVDTIDEWLSNVGPDGCYSETDGWDPIEKTAGVSVVFPSDTTEAVLKLQHQVSVESGGFSEPYDGLWVTIDDQVVAPDYGFLYQDNGGNWPHGYFVGLSDGWVVSTFMLGTEFNDGLEHNVKLHTLTADDSSNCLPLEGWQINYIELYIND